MDNILPTDLKTPQKVQAELTACFKARRLAMNLTQEGLAMRAGVSWGALKWFERTGMIAFDGGRLSSNMGVMLLALGEGAAPLSQGKQHGVAVGRARQ